MSIGPSRCLDRREKWSFGHPLVQFEARARDVPQLHAAGLVVLVVDTHT